ncbi:MAG TPA: sporulation protein YabP [Syntrophomonadaceae bacterium]|nr:sporulation protein YabP [Syntrophomonadaceae bacterium]
MPQTGQQLMLSNREKLEATGVQQVVSFDDREIVLETQIGVLVLKGEGMSITHLDLGAGELVVQGLLTSLEYSEDRGKKLKAKGKNILDRLLK